MINLSQLNERILKSGIKKNHIASEMRITPAGLNKKLTGQSDFKCKEVEVICSILHISHEDMVRIFFAQ